MAGYGAYRARQTLGLKRKEFIEAALVCGVSTRNIVLRHIVPNVLGVVVVYASLLVPSMILFESFLSFRVGHAGAAQQLGRIAQRRRQLNGSFTVVAAVPGGFPGCHSVLFQLYRRWPA